MEKIYIVLISLAFINGKEITKEINGKSFHSLNDVFDTLKTKLKSEEGFEIDETNDVLVYELPEFLEVCNEEMISLDGYWASHVKINEEEDSLLDRVLSKFDMPQ